MAKAIVLDVGNASVKAKTAGGDELQFPHAMQEISWQEYQNVKDRNHGQAPAGFIVVEGQPFVVGQTAERYAVITQLKGESRYRRDYYGILAVYAIAQLYKSPGSLMVFASYPPKDVPYREHLGAAIKGNWHIEYMGQEVKYHVRTVDTYEEPEGGLFNAMLTNDGNHYQDKAYFDGTTLVIDVGGYTTDFLGMQPGGEINEGVRDSVPFGVLQAQKDLSKTFKSAFLDATAGSHIPPERVREALNTGVIRGGGREYDVADMVDQALTQMMNRIYDSYHEVAGGPFAWDNILITGGGGGLLKERLEEVLDHEKVELSDHRQSIQMSNVRGGLKLYKMLKAAGTYA